jgi:hypothetical protein
MDKRNIAILTGKASNIIALDIDGDNSKRDFQNVIKTFDGNLRIAIDNTMYIRTGGENALLMVRYASFMHSIVLKSFFAR